MTTLGILGVGDLTEKMVRGLIRSGAFAGSAFYLSGRNREKAIALVEEFGCVLRTSNQAVVDEADVVLVGVRPAQLEELAHQLVLRTGQPIISVAAGVTVRQLTGLFGERDVSRAILSYASEINQSTVAVFPAQSMAGQLLSTLGTLVSLDTERDFELATIGACMNGWVYFLIDEMQQWLGKKGLPSETARRLVLSSVADSAAYSHYRIETPVGELGASIATPGTYTANGLEVLRERGGPDAWLGACETVFKQLAVRETE
ncbi:NAD(P)-binding domain-containing protein [Paraburkholderia rhynchosiae]|uniref:Pyrroline-5-carboxylate reductase n=1 Tax=Paraburkholderia rhynchosiae TaxID=487049 RepID=A0A2N7WHE3_9BURK|nr:NAD(P)-binding domain-containing protein [Paraburkholderia rhynchosiae]PMS28837.1 pyrroline-5-carboxylate reductase [Paraburkholderia rhynchosiae]CAB3655553.1 Pyrroline-5-carboxylate reductase [Paraburkholderia rhynchosiae]